jgi:hypothetical protein
VCVYTHTHTHIHTHTYTHTQTHTHTHMACFNFIVWRILWISSCRVSEILGCHGRLQVRCEDRCFWIFCSLILTLHVEEWKKSYFLIIFNMVIEVKEQVRPSPKAFHYIRATFLQIFPENRSYNRGLTRKTTERCLKWATIHYTPILSISLCTDCRNVIQHYIAWNSAWLNRYINTLNAE